MPVPADINHPELRAALGEAFQSMRKGDGTDAVQQLADAFLKFIELYPQYRTAQVQMRGRSVPKMFRWPGFGANLKLDSGEPRIEYTRERFAVSEAMTCYQFLLEEIIAVESGGEETPSA